MLRKSEPLGFPWCVAQLIKKYHLEFYRIKIMDMLNFP